MQDLLSDWYDSVKKAPRWSVNATNNSVLVRAYGPNSDDWIGKELELFHGEIEYQGKMQEAVLVRPISPPLKRSAKTKPKVEYDDQIEF